MLTLIIETSTEQGVVAILKGNTLLKENLLPFGYNQSNHLMPYIEALFRSLDITLQQMDYIVVGVGPGSYTGIRVGASVAKTLAYSINKPLIGVCTLEAFVPKDHPGSFVSIIDAKIGGCYLLKGFWNGEDAVYEGSPTVVALDQLQHFVKEGTLFVTPCAPALQAKIEKLYPGVYPNWIQIPPCSLQICRSALKKHVQGLSDNNLELLYLRETEAERLKNQKH